MIMKKILAVIVSCLVFGSLSAQTVNRTGDQNYMGQLSVGTGTTTYTPTDPSAALQVGLSGTTKGLLLPRVADTSSVTAPARGLMVFSLLDSSAYIYTNKWESVQFGGGLLPSSIQTVSANYTTSSTDRTILVNSSSGSITITLNSVIVGQILEVKKISSDNNSVLIKTVTGNIDGVSGSTGIYMVVPNSTTTVQWDGTNYYIL